MASFLSAFLVLYFIGSLATGSKDNVALKKPASQSSNYYIDLSLAEAGVDGNLTTFIHTATGRNFSWWKVDLEMVVEDAAVELHFREGAGFDERRSGIELYTSMNDFIPDSRPGGTVCYTTRGSEVVQRTNCTGAWQHLMLYTSRKIAGYGSFMDFTEVHVLACFRGKYGPDCNKLCTDRQCQNQSSTCHHQTGACVGGCRPGYIMTDCSQACQQDLYGAGCALSCDDRKCAQISSPCHLETGECEGGCQPGWNGTDCAAKCPDGTYGSDCRSSCMDRKCNVSTSECDHQNGTCSAGGCQAGWTGVDCTRACSRDLYGDGCALSCADRKCAQISSPCHHETGKCEGGCQPGWNGTDCATECPDGTYGSDCRSSCVDRKCNVSTSECDRQNGTCSAGGCQAWWTGVDCTRVCPNDTYGPGCGRQCGNCVGDTCHHVTGVCNCQPGWQGELCTGELTQSEGTITGVGVAVGVVIGIVVMLLVGCVTLFCLRRSGRLLWKSESHSQTPAQTSALTDMTPGSVIKDRSHISPQHVYEIPSYETEGKNDYDVIKAKEYENL